MLGRWLMWLLFVGLEKALGVLARSARQEWRMWWAAVGRRLWRALLMADVVTKCSVRLRL